jgi:starch-binding outer membrane protein, SusD/RagB family
MNFSKEFVMNKSHSHGAGLPLFSRLGALGILFTLPLSACGIDSLLDITDPDVADPARFQDAAALPAFRAAAIGDFSVAFDAAAGDNYINYTGMFSDELINAETFPTRIEIDRRDIQENNSNLQALTRNLYRARTSAEQAMDAYERLGSVRVDGFAESAAIAATLYSLFGEAYCSGVPFSLLNAQGEFIYGGRETTEQIFQRAVTTADRAIAADSAAVNTRNFARVAKGRALLNLNEPALAAAAVAGVPTNYAYFLFHSENSARENNGVFLFNTINRRVSMADSEAGEGLPYRSAFTAGDPRTPWVRFTGTSGIGFDSSTPLFSQRKYPSRSAATVVASGIEARMIEAEAALAAGDIQTFLDKLNEPRASAIALLRAQITDYQLNFPNVTANLPELTDPGTHDARVDLLFRERAFWMYLTGHRMGDMRRLIRQYGRAPNSVFPSGAYHKSVQGGQYGTDVNFPLSVDERNNPELAGIPSNESLCLNRNP